MAFFSSVSLGSSFSQKAEEIEEAEAEEAEEAEGEGREASSGIWEFGKAEGLGEGICRTLLDARLLRLVDDELLEVLLFDVGHLGNVDVAAA